MGTLTRGLLDNEQGVLPAQPPGPRDNRTPGPNYGGEQQGDHSLPGGTGSREGRLHPPAFSRAAQHGLPGRGEEGSPREQASGEEKREASCLPEAARVRSVHQNKSPNTVTVESKATCRQLLSRCLRAWRHLVQRQRAVALALALGRRRLLRKGFRALRWALQLREAWQEAAWGRHTKALLSRSFRKWKSLAVQQKQGQPYNQAVAGPPPSRGGQDQGPFLGRKAVVDPTWRSRPWCMGWHRVLAPCFSLDNFTPSPGNLEEVEEEEAWRILLYPGRRPESEDRRLQILQALQQLAVFLLRCHQKEQAMPERGLPREATGRTQSMEKPPQAWRPHATDMAQVVPLDSEHQRVWLCRCFGAWQQFMQRWARYRDHLANCQAGTLRTCLRQWVQMKQLRASDGAKVTQLSLHWQKAANLVLRSSAPEATAASHHRMLAQTQGLPQSSLQESCQKLAFLRVLLLWRTRLSLHQRANSLVQGTRKRMMRHVVRQWRLRVWGPASPSGKAHASLALEPLGSIPAGDGSLEKHPPHLEPLDNNPRDPERNGCPLGPGSEMQDCTGPVAVAADAVVGGDTVDPGAGPGTGMRCPTRLALPLATAVVLTRKVPEVGAETPPGPAEGGVPGLATGGSLSETHGPARAAPTAECLLQTPSPAPPTAGPGGHCDSGDRAPKGQCETSWKRLGGKYLHSWRLEVLLRRPRA
ncbi:uncharacterized protein C1orf167 homolog, partial [Tupaia chinensis]|uniref:uncharacterized protein C1orf167 homolog n=1 Tax=Tupaia chinensis TaxID=246437 RepID=UPI000FFC0D3D